MNSHKVDTGGIGSTNTQLLKLLMKNVVVDVQ